MASLKREIPDDRKVEPELNKTRTAGDVPEPAAKQRVALNPADCSLDFNIDGSGLQGSGFHEGAFAYCWSGARATVGISGGKYCFGCKIVSVQPVDMCDTPSEDQHLCSIGVSRVEEPVENLGETQQSFGFGSTGKFLTAGKFSDYGEKFGVGDTIVCAVDIESVGKYSDYAIIGFSKNGQWLGTATVFYVSPMLRMNDASVRKHQWKLALFPHVLLKNVVVELQFSLEDGLVPEGGFKPWDFAIEKGNAVRGPVLTSVSECEVIMMVGLPASGKTTWAEKWIRDHPEKRYVLLGLNLIRGQMKMPRLIRKQNDRDLFDRLMDKEPAIFYSLLLRAANTPRNFIIDQTNLHKSGRQRKLKLFALFKKIAAVVFPGPAELKFRSHKRLRETGLEVPAHAVNSMMASFVLPMSKDMPGSDENFDQQSPLPRAPRGNTIIAPTVMYNPAQAQRPFYRSAAPSLPNRPRGWAPPTYPYPSPIRTIHAEKADILFSQTIEIIESGFFRKSTEDADHLAAAALQNKVHRHQSTVRNSASSDSKDADLTSDAFMLLPLA
ncbi:hypothetical protein CRG98_016806 [Punica granatum]|uniref:SPRY domain-containing protein n=1 Tax=Punica granatum TaxID=22663 RepID=A0A2I0K2L5_PUNGR|nr:hypothetical protein CRG98_016806 [Punica granatum]